MRKTEMDVLLCKTKKNPDCRRLRER